jgi:hypothetical protein
MLAGALPASEIMLARVKYFFHNMLPGDWAAAPRHHCACLQLVAKRHHPRLANALDIYSYILFSWYGSLRHFARLHGINLSKSEISVTAALASGGQARRAAVAGMP